jgi:hypothetical protein
MPANEGRESVLIAAAEEGVQQLFVAFVLAALSGH